jgi:2'-5' RNA ligase
MGHFARGLYSVVAWPTTELREWLLEVQGRMGLCGFGEAHLNLRVPFEYAGEPPTLIAEVRRCLEGVRPFEVEFLRWRKFPHIIFLEYELSEALHTVHTKLLTIPGAPGSAYDGPQFIPHLSLAIGVCGWAENDVWETLQTLRPPQTRFEVNATSLTRENGGELREVHTFPLGEVLIGV